MESFSNQAKELADLLFTAYPETAEDIAIAMRADALTNAIPERAELWAAVLSQLAERPCAPGLRPLARDEMFG